MTTETQNKIKRAIRLQTELNHIINSLNGVPASFELLNEYYTSQGKPPLDKYWANRTKTHSIKVDKDEPGLIISSHEEFESHETIPLQHLLKDHNQ